VITSVVSLVRIHQFVSAGNVIDFWQYSPNSHSVGFLGQYLDLSDFSVGQIPKAAHATFGLYLSAVLAVGLALLSEARRGLSSIGLFLGIGTLVAALLYTLSRGAVATGGFVVAAGLLGLLLRRRLGTALGLGLFLVLETATLLQLNPEVSQKFASTFPGAEKLGEQVVALSAPVGRGVLSALSLLKDSPGAFQASPLPPEPVAASKVEEYSAPALPFDKSFNDRVVTWENLWALLRSRPSFFVLGVGYSIDNLAHFTGGTVVYPHSLLLDMWVRGGLLSLALVLAVWLLLFLKVVQFILSKDKLVNAFGFAVFGFLAGWFLDNALSGEQFFSDAPMLAFWGTFGFVAALAQLESKKSKVKKVLIALTSSGIGGAPKVVYDFLSNQLEVNSKQRERREFEFIVAGPPGRFLREFKKLGYKVYLAPLGQIGIGGFMRLLKISRREGVDLINSHGKGAGLYARLVGAVLGVPVVHTFHGIHYFRYGKVTRWIYFNFERLMSQFTRLVINVSASQQKEGVGLKLFPREKARVVENGMRVSSVKLAKKERRKIRERWGIGEKDFMAVVLARFDPIKGHARLVEILPVILAKVPRLKVVLVGDGEEEDKIKRLVQELGVSNAVVFAGRQNDPFQILSSAEVLLHPSYHEGLPLSPLEASALAVPVVAAQAVGNADTVLNGKTGYLVDFQEAGEVAAALKRLSRSATLRRRMGERGRRWVTERFSMEKFVKKTLAVYREALKN